jgi:pyridoxamine 5'-phosphate oxidase
MTDLRARLRAVPTLTGSPPPFDPEATPAGPHALFIDWLLAAVEAEVAEPCAATLSTVGRSGRPSGRVLILKNVDDLGWQFASTAGSRKGRELAGQPYAALTFYWVPLARQVRVSGTVVPADPADSARDFLARPVKARAEALVGKQSQRLDRPADIDEAVGEAVAKLNAEPELVASGWTLYTLRADEVEFWQADPDRRHLRLRYERTASDEWTKEFLWP